MKLRWWRPSLATQVAVIAIFIILVAVMALWIGASNAGAADRPWPPDHFCGRLFQKDGQPFVGYVSPLEVWHNEYGDYVWVYDKAHTPAAKIGNDGSFEVGLGYVNWEKSDMKVFGIWDGIEIDFLQTLYVTGIFVTQNDVNVCQDFHDIRSVIIDGMILHPKYGPMVFNDGRYEQPVPTPVLTEIPTPVPTYPPVPTSAPTPTSMPGFQPDPTQPNPYLGSTSGRNVVTGPIH